MGKRSSLKKQNNVSNKFNTYNIVSTNGGTYVTNLSNYNEYYRPIRKEPFRRNRGYETYSGYKSRYSEYKARYSTRQTCFTNKRYSRKPPSRPPSPFLGSEEYMVRKIQQTSANIMQQLLNPEKQNTLPINDNHVYEHNGNITNDKEKEVRSQEDDIASNKNKKKLSSYTAEEIHNKIMNHLTNLNDGRKKNLINSKESGYDAAIQQIVKQKRLEISRALRNMCSTSETKKCSDYINSIIPDMGIKLEDLPYEIIEELGNTLNLDLDYDVDFPNGQITEKDVSYTGLSKNQDDDVSTTSSCVENIKLEPADLILHEKNETDKTEIEQVASDNSSNLENCISVKQERDIQNPDIEITHTEDSIENNENIVDRPENNETEIIDLVIDVCDGGTESRQDTALNIYGNVSSEVIHVQDNSSQTDEEYDINMPKTFIETFMKKYFKDTPQTVSEAVARMLQIDDYILELTKYRQALFNNFINCNETCEISNTNFTAAPTCPVVSFNESDTKKVKKRKKFNKSNAHVTKTTVKRKLLSAQESKKKKMIQEPKTHDLNSQTNCHSNKTDLSQHDSSLLRVNEQNLLEFQEVKEKMLVIKVFEGQLIAAAESGKIFFCSLDDGHYTKVLEVSKFLITSLLFAKENEDKLQMYVGSFEHRLKIYDFCNHCLLQNISVDDDSIQCMESMWGYVFAGCVGGTLLRYSIKKKVFEYEDRISDNSILVLKATLEGARRVLLIGSRNSPICVRDAMTGLRMRTMEGIAPTVYSLVLDKSFVYCGTTNHDILVFSFHDGKLVHTHNAANSKGIGCMKILKNLLFASCHNGNIYVYDIKNHKFIDSIKGPGGVILSMEVLDNQVIVGTMSFKFRAIPIARYILKYRDE